MSILDERIYTESEIQLECEGKYDQEKLDEGYADDEYNHDLPSRYITNWSLKVQNKYLLFNSMDSNKNATTTTSTNTTMPNGNRKKKRVPEQNNKSKKRALDEDAAKLLSLEWTCVPLPDDDEFYIAYKDDDDEDGTEDANEREAYRNAILEGYLLPNIHFQDLPSLRVKIFDLKYVALDLKSTTRGYWITTAATNPHSAQYWLKEPSQPQQSLHLERRARLGLLSNIVDGWKSDWPERSPLEIHGQILADTGQEPFSMELFRAFHRDLQPQLLQCLSNSGLTHKCHFYKQCAAKAQRHVSTEQLEVLSEQAERRSQQYPWGEQQIMEQGHGATSLFELAIRRNRPGRKKSKIHSDFDGGDCEGNNTVSESNVWDTIDNVAQYLQKTDSYAQSRKPRSRRCIVHSEQSQK